MLGNIQCHACGEYIPLNGYVLVNVEGEVEQNFHAVCYSKTFAGRLGLPPTRIYQPLGDSDVTIYSCFDREKQNK
jgi:hypothetical protein